MGAPEGSNPKTQGKLAKMVEDDGACIHLKTPYGNAVVPETVFTCR